MREKTYEITYAKILSGSGSRVNVEPTSKILRIRYVNDDAFVRKPEAKACVYVSGHIPTTCVRQHYYYFWQR